MSWVEMTIRPAGSIWDHISVKLSSCDVLTQAGDGTMKFLR